MLTQRQTLTFFHILPKDNKQKGSVYNWQGKGTKKYPLRTLSVGIFYGMKRIGSGTRRKSVWAMHNSNSIRWKKSNRTEEIQTHWTDLNSDNDDDTHIWALLLHLLFGVWLVVNYRNISKQRIQMSLANDTKTFIKHIN
jgi:hypothetical protein